MQTIISYSVSSALYKWFDCSVSLSEKSGGVIFLFDGLPRWSLVYNLLWAVNQLATQPSLNMAPSSQSSFGQFLIFSVIFMTFLIFAEIKSFVKLKLILPNHPGNQNSGKDHHSVMLLLSRTWQKWHLPSLPTVLHKTQYFLSENSLKICFSVSWSTL